MKTFLDIFKSALWGLSTLFFILLISINAARINSDFEDILPSNYASKVQETIKLIQPEIEKLQPTLVRYDFERSAQENALVSARGRLINKLIKESCGDCDLPAFDVTEKYHLEYFMDKIQAKAMQKNIDLSNRNEYLSIIFSTLSLASCLYLIYALVKYRDSLPSIILTIAFMFPILLTTFALGSISTSEYFSTQLGYRDDPSNYWMLGISILYVFTGYPAIYTVLKKRNVHLLQLLAFRGH